jgi:hypothetical protein
VSGGLCLGRLSDVVREGQLFEVVRELRCQAAWCWLLSNPTRQCDYGRRHRVKSASRRLAAMARDVSGRLTAEAFLRATLDPVPPPVFWLRVGMVRGVWLVRPCPRVFGLLLLEFVHGLASPRRASLAVWLAGVRLLVGCL